MSEIHVSDQAVSPDALRRVAIFRELDDGELDELSRLFVELHVPADYFVIEEGEHSAAFFVIREGGVQVVSDAVGGPMTLLAQLHPGGFFGELGLFGTGKQIASVRTTKPSRLLKISKRDLLGFLARQPAIKRKLQATASYRYSTHVAAAMELGRRREVRIRFNHPVVLRLEDGTTRRATLQDLSIRGLGLDGAPPDWQQDATVRFALGLANGDLDLVGRVTWRHGDQIGMVFERRHPNHDMLIQLTIRMLLESTH